ncbi:hypothetical protein C0991_005598 [Blastosporella zonata]|nr:hypothetical protein C0991_005598 [Blastosporella zonata]
MFSRFTRLPLRRCFHTAQTRPSQSFSRLHLTIAASATVAAYVTYRLANSSHSIALDSDSSSTPHPPASSLAKSTPSSAQNYATSEVKVVPEPVLEPETVPESTHEPSDSTDVPPAATADEPSPDEAGSGGAFNPVTGEINWDCPCLGGMAHGPCGPQFREAFSCFVFSEEEPKGINCVEKFKAMQTCFREHPEIYADEIDDDDDTAAPLSDAPQEVPASDPTNSQPAPSDILSEPVAQTTSSKPWKEQSSETLA